MTVFIIRRFLLTLVMLFLVGLTVFMLGHLTGDPVRLMVPEQATEADIERLRHALGLDPPLPIQFLDFVGRALQGDLGTSLRYRQPALQLVWERMPDDVADAAWASSHLGAGDGRGHGSRCAHVRRIRGSSQT